MESFGFILTIVVAVIASQPVAGILKFVPLPIIQIAIGALLAWPLTGGVHIELEPELFLLVFIPPLLFGDAWQAPKREFWHMRGQIASMAFGLVFFTIAAFGFALHWIVPAVPLAVAFAAAAILSPTDAVAVSSIVDKDKLPPPMLHLLEGESLFNDASGLVMFRFATAAALTGTFSFADASIAFVFAVIAGVACGFFCLFLAIKALKILSKMEKGAAECQVLALVLLPFLAYLLAEHIEASGVLAAVTAGMLAGRAGLFRHLGVSARMLAVSTWQMITFALNGAIFVFLGLQLPAIMRAVPPELTAGHWLIEPVVLILSLTLCLLALRFVFMFIGGLLDRATRRAHYLFSTRMKIATSVAGVRGAVTLAAALSLPLVMPDGSSFPARDLVIFLATGVILCWLVLAWLLLPRLTNNLANDGHAATAMELKSARIAIAQAAITRLEQESQGSSHAEGAITARQAVAEGLIAGYRRRIAALEAGETQPDEAQAKSVARTQLRQAALNEEGQTLREMLAAGEINDHTAQKLFQELTLSEAALSTRKKR